MHILLISHFFPPLNEVASIRAFCFAKFWERSGVKVTVLTSNKVKNKGVKNLIKELPPTVNVIEADYKTFFPSANSKMQADENNITAAFNQKVENKHKKSLKKMAWNAMMYTGLNQHELYFWTKSALSVAEEIIEKENVTHIFSTYSPIQSHLIGSGLKKKYPRIKWTADYRDLWAINHIERPRGIFNNLNKWLEKHTVHNKADLITVISPPLKEKLESFFPGNRVEVIYNGYDPDEYKAELTAEIPSKIAATGRTISIAYLGTIYEGFRDPTPIFTALNELLSEGRIEQDDYVINFYGLRLGNLSEIIARCDASRWAKIIGQVDYETSKKVQQQADLLLFLESSDISAQGVLPGKLFEYIMSGTPIVGIGIDNTTSSGEVLINSNSGVVLGKDVRAIKQFLVEYRDTPEKYNFRTDREFFNSFSREYQSSLLLNEMRNL
jgi:glycosyltransferase involved in cell wall biosynthesis